MGELFNKVDHLYHSRSVKALQQPRFNTLTYDGWNSFSYQAAKEWNVLDNFIKDAASLNDFRILRNGMVNSVTVVTVTFVF